VQFTRILGEDFAIRIAWPDLPDPGIASYKLFRTTDPNAVGDVRNMTPFPATFAAGSGKQGEIVVLDREVQPLADTFYRLISIGPTGIESDPSNPGHGRALRLLSAAPPVITSVVKVTSPALAFQVNWQVAEALAISVQRQVVGVPGWLTLSPWLPAGTTSFVDAAVAANVVYAYRLRGRDASGIQTELSDAVTTGTV
jgi:hypothetical protein